MLMVLICWEEAYIYIYIYIYIIKENAETLLVASKEFGLEVNADETKYMVLS